MAATLKEMDAEARRLTAEAASVLENRDDHTPEEIEGAIKSITDAEALVNRIGALGTVGDVQKVKRLSEQLATFRKVDRPAFGGDGGGVDRNGNYAEIKTIGRRFVESDEFRNFRPRNQGSVAAVHFEDVDPGSLKTTLSTATAAFTGYDRQPGIVLVGQQRLTIADLMTPGTTDSPTILYPRETSYTNAATAVAEAGTKPEAAWALAEVTSPVRKIAVTAKVSSEMMADFPFIMSYVDTRLGFMVAQTEESALLNANGTAPAITGILQTAGIQTQAVGTPSATNTVMDNILKAITKVRAVGFFEPDGIVVHPTDYQNMRLSKDGQNQYYGGGPFTGAYGNGGVQEQPGIWGLKTVVTTAIAQGTALVGAWKLGAQIFRRQGLTIDMTNSNEADFKNNLVCIRAEERLALCVYRPLAFCTVTGIV